MTIDSQDHPDDMRALAPGETMLDRAVALAAAGHRESALRFAASVLRQDPESPFAIWLVSILLSDLGSDADTAMNLESAVSRAIDSNHFPLAVLAALTMRDRGCDHAGALSLIANAFGSESIRLDSEGQAAPIAPPPPASSPVDEAGAAGVAIAAGILRHALDDEGSRHAQLPTLVTPVPLFSALSSSDLAALLGVFRIHWVPAGKAVLTEGEFGEQFFLVVRGELSVTKAGPDGEPIALARLRNGALFGEMALVSRAPRAATVIAEKPSILLEADVHALEQAASVAPAVGAQVAKFCSDRMLANLVRTSPVLSALSPASREKLIAMFESQTFESGDVLITRGAPGERLFLIASGLVDVATGQGEDRVLLANLGPGEVVGEISLILRRAAMADVVAVHPTVALTLSSGAVRRAISEDPVLLAKLYELAIQREQDTSSVVAQIEISDEEGSLILL